MRFKAKAVVIKYSKLISLENKTYVLLSTTDLNVGLCPLAQPTSVYQQKKKKKDYAFISIPISYDSRSTVVSSGAEKCSFEKSPRRARRLPTSIFDAVAHFVCLPQESQTSPSGGMHTQASQLLWPLPAPAHCCPVCGSAVQLQAREQSKLMPHYSSTPRASQSSGGI